MVRHIGGTKVTDLKRETESGRSIRLRKILQSEKNSERESGKYALLIQHTKICITKEKLKR